MRVCISEPPKPKDQGSARAKSNESKWQKMLTSNNPNMLKVGDGLQQFKPLQIEGTRNLEHQVTSIVLDPKTTR